MFRIAIFASAWLIMSAQINAADDAKDELKKLEGSWIVEEAEIEGAVLPKGSAPFLRITIKGDRIHLDQTTARLSIDPGKKPKHMEATDTDGKDQVLFIYDLDGDKLKIAFGFESFLKKSPSIRPKSFETKGTTVIRLSLKREKNLANSADVNKSDLKKLEGSWNVASAEINGIIASDGKKFGMTGLLIADGKLTFQNDGKPLMTFTFTVDPSKKPKAMDWVKDKERSILLKATN